MDKSESKDILKFSIIATSVIVILVLLFSTNIIENALISFTAKSTNALLNLFGVRTSLRGNTIALLSGTQTKLQIIPDCTGIYPFIIMVGFILAYPSKLKNKLLGILFGGILSLLVNYIRLITLIVVAEKSYDTFQYLHIFIWQTTFIILVIFYFLWWINWSKKPQKKIKAKI